MNDRSAPSNTSDRMRIDKWLWVARFYKTRALAQEQLGLGRVQCNGLTAKPSRDIQIGDRIELRQGPVLRVVEVTGLAPQRGSATVAAQLYTETPDSIAQRERLAEQRRLAPEPALSQPQGRPTKRDRRSLERTQSRWDDRWSASAD